MIDGEPAQRPLTKHARSSIRRVDRIPIMALWRIQGG
jgi:uncharacterized protein (UPF0297 family)